jgi:hypothetical protein
MEGRGFTHTAEFVLQEDRLKLADATGATKHSNGLEEQSHNDSRLRPNAERPKKSVPGLRTAGKCTRSCAPRVLHANIQITTRLIIPTLRGIVQEAAIPTRSSQPTSAKNSPLVLELHRH